MQRVRILGNDNNRGTQDILFRLFVVEKIIRHIIGCVQHDIFPFLQCFGNREVLSKMAPLPVADGVYTTYEGIPDMWTKYTYEHPALTGVYGMLPGDGVDQPTFKRTLEKVSKEWQFNRIWGWDFPMLAMAAARTGQPALAIDMLMHPSAGFQFDEHGLATGGPFPYFPSNGALLTAVAMMCGGWDGSEGEAPGFPKDGSWTVRYEGFVPMQ